MGVRTGRVRREAEREDRGREKGTDYIISKVELSDVIRFGRSVSPTKSNEMFYLLHFPSLQDSEPILERQSVKDLFKILSAANSLQFSIMTVRVTVRSDVVSNDTYLGRRKCV